MLIPPLLSPSLLPHLGIVGALCAEGRLNELISVEVLARASFYSLGGKVKHEVRRTWSTTICRKGDSVSHIALLDAVWTLRRQPDIFQPLNQSCFASWKLFFLLWSWLLTNTSSAPPRGQGQGKRYISDTLEEG